MELWEKFKSKSTKENHNFETYFSRFLRIKDVVESNPCIMKGLENIFRAEYLNEEFNKDILEIGSGGDHKIFSPGDFEISDNGNRLMLALKILD
ncbi:MAG: hypothetical protein KC516_03930 [Nanoarchaeota archaeon]|nr:hypothetical protein [Nanoarchaeota archaeon]